MKCTRNTFCVRPQGGIIMKVNSIKLNNSSYKPNNCSKIAYFRGNSSSGENSSDRNKDVTQFAENISPALRTDFTRTDPIGSTFNNVFKTLKRFFRPEFNNNSWSEDDIDLIIFRSLTN